MMMRDAVPLENGKKWQFLPSFFKYIFGENMKILWRFQGVSGWSEGCIFGKNSHFFPLFLGDRVPDDDDDDDDNDDDDDDEDDDDDDDDDLISTNRIAL